MVGRKKRYALADSAQQVVGGFLLAGPFVVTEEVWVLASNMTVYHALVTVGIVFGVGYGALYKADDERDPEREADVGGIPLRFVSLMAVAYGSVTILAIAITAPTTFVPSIIPGVSDIGIVFTTAKAMCVSAIFSVVGAATADSLL